MASELLDIAKASGELESDPAATYRKMHATGERYCLSADWGLPIFFKYADVGAMLRDPLTFSNCGRVVNHLKVHFPEEAGGELRPLVDHYTSGLINSDPPDHTRLRRLIQSTFLPRTLERLRSRVDVVCNELLDTGRERGTIEFVSDFAFLLPVTMIAELMGIPHGMRDQFKDWSTRVVEFMARPNPSLDAMRRSQTALLELRAYFASVFVERRKQPGEDLISLLVAAEVDGDRLTEDELQGTCVTLLIGGHETTTSLLTSSAWLIGTHPEVRAGLLEDPTRVSSAVEEFLRVEPPFQKILRVASKDTEVAGCPIAAGSTVVLLLGAANRDPDQFPEPDAIQIQRSPNKHLAFGYGIHHCLGAALARLEAPAALGHLLRRFPHFTCTSTSPVWHDGMVRAITKLEIQLE